MSNIILAGGCFWCLEAVFKRLRGVEEVIPGYTGGEIKNPTYEAVSSGATGHAEAVKIIFDPKIISLETLLEIFFALIDPTTLNRQGNDVGTQYRSEIFYANEAQRDVAKKAMQKAEKSGKFADPIVTQITTAGDFYQAEKYHKNYYDSNRSNSYCKIIIDPKIQKLYKKYRSKLKPENSL